MRLYNGDCIEVLKQLEENSVDAIVTDPPYELGFMGKSWDGTGIANDKEMWADVLRVLKPGGHLLAFSGTRTYHRMAVAIEDAGFEVRDMIEWVYGSGFPKSRNIGLDVDKRNGVTKNRGKAFVVAGQSGQRDKDTGGDLVPGSNTMGAYVAKNEWSGWGTALKPAHEPICMARKPLAEKTVAENCLKWGTGGINIDESRVGLGDEQPPTGSAKRIYKSNGYTEDKIYGDNKETSPLGRFPANLIHDNSEEVRECFPESTSGAKKANQENYNHDGKEFVATLGASVNEYQASSGNASRFFKSIPQDKKVRGKTSVVCNFCGIDFDKKNSQLFTDRHFCSRKCFGEWQSKFLLGENSYNWKDGKMDLISRVRSLKKMIDWRNEVYKRDNYTCKKCGDNTGGNLQAHHIHHLSDLIRELNLIDITDAIESDKLWDITNGTTLCDSCHTETHKSLIYQAKASKSERNKGCEELEEKDSTARQVSSEWKVDNRHPDGGYETAPQTKATNNHPTVKPIALMEYLIKMVTPKGGTVLDPFMGSGSTGVAAKRLKRHFIGIEREADYIKIAEARINAIPDTLI